MSFVAFAFRRSVLNGRYNFNLFKADFSSAILVSLISLPLSMALAITIGLPPAHGIYTAIIACFFYAIFGGSVYQISGPTGAFVAVLAPIVHQYGLRGLVVAEVMAGVLLIVMSFTRLARLIKYIPYTVIIGFTAGIAVVLTSMSIKDFFGLDLHHFGNTFHEKIIVLAQNIIYLKPGDTLIGIITCGLMIYCTKRKTRFPPVVIAIVTASIGAYLINKYSAFHIDTLEDVFPRGGGGIPASLDWPHFFTSKKGELFSWPSYMEMKILFIPALSIAILAGLESLLAAVMADTMAGTKHQPDAELFGTGIANIMSALWKGIPATGALARTAANVKAGGKTSMTGILVALLITLYIYILSPVIYYIPMSSLAGILLIVAYNMAHIKEFKFLLKNGYKTDVIVLLVSFLLTVIFNMIIGVAVGLAIAFALFAHMVGTVSRQTTVIEEKIVDNKKILYIKPQGILFFGSAGEIFEQDLLKKKINVLLLDLSNISMIDSNALNVLNTFFQKLPGDIVLCGNENLAVDIASKLKNYDFIVYPKAENFLKETI